MDKSLQPILAEKLQKLAKQGIKHGFFTRNGGVSSGIYDSLNLGRGSDDLPENIANNRQKVAEYFAVDVDRLATIYQIHSNEVLIIDDDFVFNKSKGEKLEGDALVTNVKGLALGILTADCGPILFADADAKVIGAAHAGWRGALNGVIENVILKMEVLGAKRQNIIAVLGPCIGENNYEVGGEFRQKFIDKSDKFASFFTHSEKPSHYIFNLWGFILYQLQKSGVNGSCLELCTYKEEQHFFSYRRKTHRNENDYGRQISVIMLENGE